MTENVLGAKQVAVRLGISERTALRYMQDGTLPGWRMGKKVWRMEASDLLAYIGLVRALHQNTAVENKAAVARHTHDVAPRSNRTP
jgi:excisionase family DNA binding protein